MLVKITVSTTGNPAGKLADAELHFGADRFGPKDGEALEGLKLIGFGVWERRDGTRTVTFPARQYSVNGERRSVALLRPIKETSAQTRIKDLILQAYAERD
jgi:hypothetical protein